MIDTTDLFSDQSHIDQVRDALWGRHGNGASVMVGSGLSRCALKAWPDAGEAAMLSDLAFKLHQKLYPHSSEMGAADRVLSLAQEYEAAFGRTNLHQLLQQLVRDDDLKPWKTHSRLLQLPWRDVFTTNWDTLLERARLHVVDRGYSVVRDTDEIPLAKKPRVFKLHGSLPAQFPLILTEEDYRTYPTKFAPFVNTVQQAMMETVFCLIGFSGDDPNFLNWSGWVRDNLGDSTPRIYLAGWLDLPHHRRRMLESRGIVPIDLARHPKAHEWPEHQRYQYAIDWVLHTLERGRPYDLTYWPLPTGQPSSKLAEHLRPVGEATSNQPQEEPAAGPNTDQGEVQERVKETLSIWRHNRQVYPGWLLLPSGEERASLRRRTDSWEQFILKALPGLTPVERLNAIHELVWRREILLEPLSDTLASAAADALRLVNCQDSTIDGVAEPGDGWSDIRAAWRSVGLALTTAARFRFDENLFIEQTQALAPYENDHPDVHHRLSHERCLWAVYSMDFESLEHLLDSWTVRDCDPIWMIRKAALLWESNRNDEAAELVKQGLDAIRSKPDAEGSAAGVSREGWAMWSAISWDNQREFRKRWDELSSAKCDAMLELDIITRQIHGGSDLREAPLFDLGKVRRESVWFSSSRSNVAAYRSVLLCEVAGLPPATKHTEPIGTSVVSHTLKSAAEVLAATQPELAIRLVLRVCDSETDKTLNRVLSRTIAATLSDSSLETLSNICIGVIRYAFPRLLVTERRQRSLFWMTRMRVAMEVLSRLALRAAPAKAETFLEIGLQCYQSREVVQEPWLHKPLENLLKRSWEALPTERRIARALGLLSAPIPGMDNLSASAPDHLVDLGELLQPDDLPSERTEVDDDRQWHDAIRLLLRGLTETKESRERAVTRIGLVSERGLLTEAESSEFAQALWSAKFTAPDSLPEDTGLSDWALLLYPEPITGVAEQRFRLKWLSGDASKLQDIVQRDGNTVSIPSGSRPVDPSRIGDVLWNVGAALSELRSHGRPLQLSDDERKYMVNVVERWIDTDTDPHSLRFLSDMRCNYTRWALRGMASILAEGVIPKVTGERIFEKVKDLGESAGPGYVLMHGLVETIPDRFDEIASWLRSGLVSDDEDVAFSAISGLHSWLVASIDAKVPLSPPPDDMLSEIGLIIASRRKVSLPHALQVAEWVFSHGTSEHRNVISTLALQGLTYLAEELRYDRAHGADENTDLPLLRWRCAQLAQSMAESGLRDEPAVYLWITLAKQDPLPEVRFAAGSSAHPET